MADNWKGTWLITTPYVVNDVVTYNSNMFQCIQANTGQTPVIGTDTAYWTAFNLNTVFPANIDQFITRNPVLASDVTDLNTYKTLTTTANLTPTQQDQLTALTTTLRDKILLPLDVNLIQQAIQNLEAFFLNSVNGYVNQQTSSFDATLKNFSYQEVWSSVVTYKAWNIITYSNGVYFAKQASTNIAPTTGDSNDAYWCLLSKQGEQGVPGLNLNYKGDYNNSVAYVIGDAVTYNSVIYYCKASSTGNLPTNGTYWTVFDKVFVGSAPPASPFANQLWLDTGTNLLKYYSGSSWIEVGASGVNVTITDAGSLFTATNVEGALQEIAGVGRTTETVKGNADNLTAHLAESATLATAGHVQLQTTLDNSETKALTPNALFIERKRLQLGVRI